MGRRHLQLVIGIGLLFVYLAAAVSCSQPQSKPAPKQSSEESKPVPGELKQLQGSLDQLYEELKPELPKTEGEQQEGGQTGQQNSEQGGQQKGKIDQSQQQGGEVTNRVKEDKLIKLIGINCNLKRKRSTTSGIGLKQRQLKQGLGRQILMA